MQFYFAAVRTVESGAWVVGAAEGVGLLGAATKADKASGGAISRAMPSCQFTGKAGQVMVVLAPAGVGASRLVVLGLGKPEQFDAAAAESAAAAAVGKLAGSAETQITFELDAPKGAKVKGAQLAAHLAFGAKLKSYAFNQYRTKDHDEHQSKLANITILTGDVAAARRAWTRLEAVADGVFLARDLVNEPPNVLSPAEFARRAAAASPVRIVMSASLDSISSRFLVRYWLKV